MNRLKYKSCYNGPSFRVFDLGIHYPQVALDLALVNNLTTPRRAKPHLPLQSWLTPRDEEDLAIEAVEIEAVEIEEEETEAAAVVLDEVQSRRRRNGSQ